MEGTRTANEGVQCLSFLLKRRTVHPSNQPRALSICCLICCCVLLFVAVFCDLLLWYFICRCVLLFAVVFSCLSLWFALQGHRSFWPMQRITYVTNQSTLSHWCLKSSKVKNSLALCILKQEKEALHGSDGSCDRCSLVKHAKKQGPGSLAEY